MNTDHYAWVTISGKVYVPDDEIDALIETGEDEFGDPVTTEREAFEAIARQKLREMIAIDAPFKRTDTEIDMTTFASC
jgi:ribosomal protein S1